jgi:multicomponent Na+:H+ antiporter subunit B
MRSLILLTAIRYLLPLLLIFSIFVLLRGHNDPGGGFVGGLVAAAAFALYAIAVGVPEARKTLRANPRVFVSLGLFLAVVSGMVSLFLDLPFMTGVWVSQPLPALGKVGTPSLFDLGVALVVVGVTLLIIFSLAEER